MWQYKKKLEYPVNIKNPNPALAKVIISQFGGPDFICNYYFNIFLGNINKLAYRFVLLIYSKLTKTIIIKKVL